MLTPGAAFSTPLIGVSGASWVNFWGLINTSGVSLAILAERFLPTLAWAACGTAGALKIVSGALSTILWGTQEPA